MRKTQASGNNRNGVCIKTDKSRLHFLALAIVTALGITACEDSSESSRASELKAALTASNQLTSIGSIHLDLSDSIFDSIESVSYSIKVTDAETNQVVYEVVDLPANDIPNLGVNFSPLEKNIPHWQPYNLERLLAIDYTLHHQDGRSDGGREYIYINEKIAIGDVSGRPAQPASKFSASATEVTATSNTPDCRSTCFVSNRGLPTCTVPVEPGCYTLDMMTLKDLANSILEESDGGPVTKTTPAWLQAAGGFGGNQFENDRASHRSGGSGGLALTVTTILDIEVYRETYGLPTNLIYYYAAKTGSHHKHDAGTGGASTLVTRREITGKIEHITDIILIAGGGGGAASDGRGGRGGIAIASAAKGIRIFSSAAGDTGGRDDKGGYGGGSSIGIPFGGSNRVGDNGETISNDGSSNDETGTDSGTFGFGGNTGNNQGWLNKDISAALEGQGTGGLHSHRYGGGGGGFGGGATGSGHRNKGHDDEDSLQGADSLSGNAFSYGGGGGGSFAMVATVADAFTPTDVDTILDRAGKMHLGSNGWFRVTFNILANEQTD